MSATISEDSTADWLIDNFIPESIVHRCPPAGSGVMPCCGRTPFEVPRVHRMTTDPAMVTCSQDQSVAR